MSGSGDPKTIRRSSLALKTNVIAAVAFILIILTGSAALSGGSSGNMPDDTGEDLAEKNILSVPYYNQGDTNWCLYYCLAMMYDLNNCSVKPWEIAESFGSGHSETFTEQYIPYDNSLQEHAKRTANLNMKKTIWGYNLGQFDADNFNEVIRNSIDRGQPILMAFQYKVADGTKEGHAILAVGYDDEYIYLTDPSGAITAGLFKNTDGHIAVPITWDEFKEIFSSKINLGNMAFTIETLNDAPDSPTEGSIYITDHSNSGFSCLSFTDKNNINDVGLLRFDGKYENGYTVVSKEDVTAERKPSTQDYMSVHFTVSNPTATQKEYTVKSNVINTNTGEVMESFYFKIDVNVAPFDDVSKGINYSNQLEFIPANDYRIVLTLQNESMSIVDSVCIDLCVE
jgi:uncharacterized protein YvpB